MAGFCPERTLVLGSHRRLVKPPVVEELAARLQACIDSVADN